MRAIAKRIEEIKENKERLTMIGNMGFLGFYGIMVITKTFGYVSYESFFKMAFVLALAGLGCKVLTTRYTMREFLILYLLLAVSVVCWLRVGEKNVMFITLCLWGMKGMNFATLMKQTLWIRIPGTALMILLAFAGVLELQPGVAVATDYDEFLVYGLGYIKANAAFYIVFLIVAVWLYVYYDKLNGWHFMGSVIVVFAMFKVTYCRTGVVVLVGMWLLILLDKLCRHYKKYYKLMAFTVAGLFAISFLATVIYRGGPAILSKVNRMLNGRVELASNYHEAYGITLFPKTANIFWDMNYTTIDNLYMYLFISCGAVFTLFFVYAASKALLKLSREGYYREIIFFVVFAVYAMLEQSPMNPILNPFVLLVGNLIYGDFRIREKDFGKEQEIKHITSA